MERKSVLILGAGSDLGRQLCKEYAKASGWELWLGARDMEYLKALQSDLEIRFSAKVEVFHFDASEMNSHETFFENLPAVPDELVWTIGYLGNQDLAESDWAEANQIITANYLGAVSVLNIAAAAFSKRKSGVIAGISSVAGVRGRQSNYIYGSAKAGLTAYLSGLRNKLYHCNVHVVTVQPGFMKTKMIAGIETSPLLTISPEAAAKKVFRAIRKRKNVVYIFGIWRLIMFIIKSIPEFIFKRLRL